MADKAFFDTNVLVYAFEREDLPRQRAASAVLDAALSQGTAVLSLQVLQEFYVVTTRKIRLPLPPAAARAAVAGFMSFSVFEPNAVHVLRAIDLSIAHRISFWDALILASAAAAGCALLYSEDFATGQTLAGVRVVNPFH